MFIIKYNHEKNNFHHTREMKDLLNLAYFLKLYIYFKGSSVDHSVNNNLNSICVPTFIFRTFFLLKPLRLL